MVAPGARRSSGRKAKTGEGSACLMGCEVGPVEPCYQRQDLLGRPASAVDHHEMLLDRFGQRSLEGRFHAPRIQVVAVAETVIVGIGVSDPYSPQNLL